MKLSIIFAAAVLALALAEVTPAMAAGWKCTASKLKSYRYTGGSKAYIHLSPYGRGGWYRVKKVSPKKVTGKTKDGTRFSCTA